ncbi:MAG: RagB/SusD family nutrient uptake outer membrane protein [Bacteroidales bacterium]|nr:RagB/SusD family nutrient uptake outer membrane protein [Bacteroidales bacterium]
MKTKYQHILVVLSISILLSACDLLDITPKHVVPLDKAFSDVESYQMALNNVYRRMTSSVMNMQSTDFAGDDFESVVPGFLETNYYIYNWDYKTQPQPFVWSYQYQLIAQLNSVIDAYDIVPAKDDNEQRSIDQIYAQALGVRCWSLFNLAQLYAPRYDGSNGQEKAIPLKLKLELEYLPQASLEEVYTQIFEDLELAQRLLIDSNYAPSFDQRAYQFGLGALRALEARVALFTGDIERARTVSAHFINTPLLDKSNYWMLWEDQYGTTNQEVIFMTHDLSDTDDADLIDYYEVYLNNRVHLSQDLISSFDADDIRKSSDYIGAGHIPSKYITPINERNSAVSRNLNYKYMRLAEQYLIYAEAVLSSEPNEAMRVLNILKEKRGAELLTEAPDKADILAERRREFFSEGLRFYDLKRLSGELNLVVSRPNGKVLAPNSSLYIWDIPKEEINSNPYIN